MKRKSNKIISLILCAAMTLSLAACGKQEEESSVNDIKEFVYVPEYIKLSGEDGNSNFGNLDIKGNTLYYTLYSYDEETMTSTETLCEYSITDGSVKEIAMPSVENGNISGYELDGSGNMYIVVSDYSSERVNAEGFSVPDVFVRKYDDQGAVVFEKDITKTVSSTGEYVYVRDVILDEQGNIYICLENAVLLMTGEGEEHGLVQLSDGWINSTGLGKDGKLYIGYYDYTSAGGGAVLSDIDFAGKKIGNTYKNVPSMNGGMSVGMEKDFLVHDGSKVYEYEIATQTYEELFSWLDCDINGSYVEQVGVTENGTLVAVVRDWDTGITELVKLNKTAASEVVQKEEIVIGTLYESQDLQAAAVAFNKANDTYHVTIKTYIDQNNWTETSYQDGITNLNNDITSGSNCPDILDLSQVNARQLAAKGALEDLIPYLEKSSVFSKEDFVENIIDGFTYDGILVGIPATFNINTIVGKTSVVGEEMGWTLDEMIAFAKDHPDAELFSGVDQNTILYSCMMFNQDAFVDWSASECHFDSQEFKTLLEFVGMFPSEIDWANYDGGPMAEEKQAGKILLQDAYISDFQDVQMYPAMYGEDVTFIGFPTTDGSVGSAMSVGTMYGITSKSEYKDGAWAFIESYLAQSADSMFSWGFPTMKDKLQEKIEEVTKVEYMLDENGEKVLDENGEPITMNSGTHSMSWGDWEYTYHTPTMEEVEQVKKLIEVSTPSGTISNDEIMTIITEETEAYFKGQKSLDEVVGIIQSRAQIYVSENS